MAIGSGLAIDFMDLVFRLSGGAANADPSLSLGGAMSSTRILSQSGTGIVNITGVTFVDGVGNALGNGTLFYTDATTSLAWTPQGVALGIQIDVSVDGRYGIPSSLDSQYIVVDVVAGSLPVADQNDTVVIVDLPNLLWDDVLKAESSAGDSEFRCIYLVNPHGTDSAFAGALFIAANTPGVDLVQIGLDPAGLNGTATTIVDENTAPAGVVYTSPTGPPGLSIGNLTPSDNYPFWINRVVTINTTTPEPNNTFQIGVEAGF